jgi:hypothetical protein
MIGRILNTLEHRLKKEEWEWRSKNVIRREMAYSCSRGVLIRMAEDPVLWPLSVLGISLIASLGLWFFTDCWVPNISFDAKQVLPGCWVPMITVDTKSIDVNGYFFALWSVQAAVAALVYPIVIAFVTLLLQRHYNAKSVLHIYLHDSAAILSGLSALFLIILMGIQYLFLAIARKETGVGWIIIDAVWLLGNLALTSVFLYQTFEFIRPSRRSTIIRHYVVNETWPRELKEHLRGLFFRTAVEEHLLPGPGYARGQNDTKPSILLGLGSRMGDSAIERQLPRNSRLTDVRFRFLGWATRLWLKRANRTEAKKGPQNRRHVGPIAKGEELPVLLYPLDPGSTYSGKTSLCRVIGSTLPSVFEELLIRFAFKFRRTFPSVELTVAEVLDDLRAEAMLCLRSGEVQAFSAAVDELAELYALVIQAGACRNSAGDVENYARVSGLGFSPLYSEWARRLVDLSIAAAERLHSDESFFADLVQVPNTLFSKLVGEEIQSDILSGFVETPRTLFHYLLVWWTTTLEQQGLIEHDPCNPSSLRPPFYRTHNSILITFVSSWESLKNFYFPPRRNETPTWPELQRASDFFEKHLHETALMIMESVHLGDEVGTERILDVLLNWIEQLRFRFDTQRFLFRRETLVSFETIKRSWEEVQGVLDVEGGGHLRDTAPKAIFGAALQNYWIDVCCTIVYMLIIRGKHCPCERSLPARAIRGILFGETHRKEAGLTGVEPVVRNANDLFMAILRQYHTEGAYRKGYRAKLDRLVERLRDITREPMVPGRVYSRWGGDDLDSVRDGQLVLLTLLVAEHWNPTPRVEPTIREWVQEDDSKLQELLHDLHEWQGRIESPEFAEYREVFLCIKGARMEPSFDQAIESVKTGIAELTTNITAIRTETVRGLPISETRLQEVGKWASVSAFSKGSGGFPLPLFNTVTATEELFQSRSLILQNLAKGEFTEREMAQRAANEDEWFRELIRDHVAASVLHEVILQLGPQQQDGSNPEVYWEQITIYNEIAKRENRHAILLIENRTVPEWVYNWTDTYGRRDVGIPSGMDVWRDPQATSDAYISNLNEVRVYVAPLPLGASVLLTTESLQLTSFTKLQNGNFVLVEAISNDEKPAVIDLKLTWYFDVTVDPYPAVRLTYGRSQP